MKLQVFNNEIFRLTIKRNKIAIKGPVTTPVGKGFKSVNVTLRQTLDLYVNLIRSDLVFLEAVFILCPNYISMTFIMEQF